MYPSNLRAEFVASCRARRQEKFMIYFLVGCTSYVAGLATIIWFLSAIS